MTRSEVAEPAVAPAALQSPTCPSCRGGPVEVFHEASGVPVHSCRLVDTREEALRFPQGTLRLGLCQACGFITNIAFDGFLQDYSMAYEETQGFSPRFREFALDLAERWIDRHALRGKALLEIGCGKGEFLSLMCELGGNAGIGIDPAIVPERLKTPAGSDMTWIVDLFSDRHAEELAADAVLCRHTLEHIGGVHDFLQLVRRTAERTPGCVVLFDLPDVRRVLREAAFWDVYYEHCSYFSAGSLARLFRRCGFDIVSLERDYDDQYLVIDAVVADGSARGPFEIEEAPEELAADVDRFRADVASARALWDERLGAARADGRRTVVWGAGSKAVAFLTTLGAAGDVVAAVDINPYKQGKYLAGTGHPVVGPDALRDLRPDLVVAMNAIYLDEIRSQLHSLGLSPELIAV